MGSSCHSPRLKDRLLGRLWDPAPWDSQPAFLESSRLHPHPCSWSQGFQWIFQPSLHSHNSLSDVILWQDDFPAIASVVHALLFICQRPAQLRLVSSPKYVRNTGHLSIHRALSIPLSEQPVILWVTYLSVSAWMLWSCFAPSLTKSLAWNSYLSDTSKSMDGQMSPKNCFPGFLF